MLHCHACHHLHAQAGTVISAAARMHSLYHVAYLCACAPACIALIRFFIRTHPPSLPKQTPHGTVANAMNFSPICIPLQYLRDSVHACMWVQRMYDMYDAGHQRPPAQVAAFVLDCRDRCRELEDNDG